MWCVCGNNWRSLCIPVTLSLLISLFLSLALSLSLSLSLSIYLYFPSLSLSISFSLSLSLSLLSLSIYLYLSISISLSSLSLSYLPPRGDTSTDYYLLINTSFFPFVSGVRQSGGMAVDCEEGYVRTCSTCAVILCNVMCVEWWYVWWDGMGCDVICCTAISSAIAFSTFSPPSSSFSSPLRLSLHPYTLPHPTTPLSSLSLPLLSPPLLLSPLILSLRTPLTLAHVRREEYIPHPESL